MVDRLKDKVALITGGSRGQGAAEAELFTAEGAAVVIADVLDSEGAKTAASIGDAASYHHLDVTNEEAWHALVAEIVEQHGRLDVLVNNAGIYRNASIVEMTEDMYRQVIDINQIGVWLGMKAVGPQMIAQQSGSVVNISSTAGFRGGAGSIAYTASKFARARHDQGRRSRMGSLQHPRQQHPPRPNRHNDAAAGARLRGRQRKLPAETLRLRRARRPVRGGLPRALSRLRRIQLQHRLRVRRRWRGLGLAALAGGQ